MFIRKVEAAAIETKNIPDQDWVGCWVDIYPGKFLLPRYHNFMLGKYSLILSTFKCCHKKGKVDKTRRYNFRLFQVFFRFFPFLFFFFFFLFFFVFSPVLLPKAKYNRKKNISRRLLISALTIKLDWHVTLFDNL